jgi:hypothetical protein
MTVESYTLKISLKDFKKEKIIKIDEEISISKLEQHSIVIFYKDKKIYFDFKGLLIFNY